MPGVCASPAASACAPPVVEKVSLWVLLATHRAYWSHCFPSVQLLMGCDGGKSVYTNLNSLHAPNDRNSSLVKGTKYSSYPIERPPKVMWHTYEPRHFRVRFATSRRPSCFHSCISLMFILFNISARDTHLCAGVCHSSCLVLSTALIYHGYLHRGLAGDTGACNPYGP